MPKRALDTSQNDAAGERAQKKTERSHEENQERAYIAASRRADRSIEARVQSARMASEIHKKRTGKGFKISEEIVMKEEMYEEEEDELPRHYRALAAHLRTSSADMNNRLSAYLTNQVAMASLARQQEVNRMFAEQFPNASQISQQLSQSMYLQPLQANADSPTATTFSQPPVQAREPGGQRGRSQSSSQLPDASPRQAAAGAYVSSPAPKHLSVEDKVSPPALTPTSVASEATAALSTPDISIQAAPFPTFSAGLDSSRNALADHTASLPSLPEESSFTAELPQEAKMMVNIDMNDPMAHAFFGGEMMGTENLDMFGDFSVAPQSTTTAKGLDVSEPEGYFSSALHAPSKLIDIPGQRSTIGTPGGGEGDSWESWVNTDQWGQIDGDGH